MQVLIVEDEKVNAEILRNDLKQFGVSKIRVFHTGTEALDHLASFKYDLLIIDLKLPDIDGITLVRTFRKTDLTTKIILITGTIEKDTFNKTIGLGVSDILCKPYDKNRLLKHLNLQTLG